MNVIRCPESPWELDSVVVAAETIELAGASVPISYSLMVVENQQIRDSHFIPIAWDRRLLAKWRGLNAAEVQAALQGADTLRQISSADLETGETPEVVYEYLQGIFAFAAEEDIIIVTHGENKGLASLLTAIERQLGTTLPPLDVVCTGILERARRAKVVQRDDESPSGFYRRIKNLRGEVPGVATCLREHKPTNEHSLSVFPFRSTDSLFPLFATHWIYQFHCDPHLESTPCREG